MNLFQKFFSPVDMTEGRPWEDILIFTVPMLLGNIAQQLYSTVDSIVVGQYVGDNALAAVGSATPISNLLIVLFIGIAMGASIMVSQYLGARNREDLSRAIGNCIVLTAIASAVVAVMALLFVRPLLELLHTPDSIIDWSASYLRIMLTGAIGLSYFNILSGVLRGLGDSMSALLYLIIASVTNIVLDIVFVANFGMGVNGVAYATVIAQGVSALLCFRRLLHFHDMFDLTWSSLKVTKKHMGGIIRLGIPSGVTQAVMSMAMILVQSLTNSFGEQFIAASVIVTRVDGFAMLPNFSFATAMTTYAGQNIGAKKLDRLHQGARQGMIMGLAVSTVITATILFFGRGLMSIFTDTHEIVELSMKMMQILAVGYIAMAVIQSLSGVMRGAGDTLTPMVISMIMMIGIRVPLAYVMVYLTRSTEYPIGRSECIYWSLLISWIIGAILSIVAYRRGKWKGKGI